MIFADDKRENILLGRDRALLQARRWFRRAVFSPRAAIPSRQILDAWTTATGAKQAAPTR